jgi:hypothetical protein
MIVGKIPETDSVGAREIGDTDMGWFSNLAGAASPNMAKIMTGFAGNRKSFSRRGF